MKIEKINDNQIRCFLSSEDLASRQMKISELAYGTEKARNLFHEMMNYAHKKCGFNPEDMPLMIEAVPFSPDTILLTITKIAFPDELDSRFAYFSDSDMEDSHMRGHFFGNSPDLLGYREYHNADDIVSLCNADDDTFSRAWIRHFVFPSLNAVIEVSRVISDYYHAENRLYKDIDGSFHLIVTMGNHTPSEFNKICNSLSEYGIMQSPGKNTYSKIIEHAKLISSPHALSDLASL